MNGESPRRTPTAYIVDDDRAVLDSLCWLLEGEGIATSAFASAEDFLNQYDDGWQGCILLDVRMPGTSGLDVQDTLAKRGNRLPIIVITGHADVPVAIRAMKAGAFDFIEKPFSDDVMIDCIRRAMEEAGRDREATAHRNEIRSRYQGLTPREQEVLERVVDGQANKVIAAELKLSVKTVEVHRSRIMQKMRARSLSELVRMAVEAELV